MVRDDILQFFLEYARDEQARAEARVSLLETKLALTAALVGLLLTLLATLWPTHVPHPTSGSLLLLLFAVIALCASMFGAILGSLLSWIDAPGAGTEVSEKGIALLQELGKPELPLDAAKAEELLGEVIASYNASTTRLSKLINDRSRKLHFSQIAMLCAIVFLTVLLLLPWAVEAYGALMQ